MPQERTESGMVITFPDDWKLLDYDNRAERKAKTPQDVFPYAVDFVLLRSSGRKTISFLELKGFQKMGSANRSKLANGELETEMAKKVRDTIAGIVGFSRTSAAASEFAPFAKALGDNGVRFEINLWIEADHTLLGKREKRNIDWNAQRKDEIQRQIEKFRKARDGTFLKRMKRALSWASAEIQLCHSQNVGSFIPGTTARQLAP